MTQAVRRAVVATGTTRALALKVAERREWEGYEDEWVRRVDNMLSDGSPLRVFPADCIPDAIEVTRDVSILAPAHAAVIRVQAEDSCGEGWSPARAHNPDLPGSIPGAATKAPLRKVEPRGVERRRGRA